MWRITRSFAGFLIAGAGVVWTARAEHWGPCLLWTVAFGIWTLNVFVAIDIREFEKVIAQSEAELTRGPQ